MVSLTNSSAMASYPLTVFYDGACPLCRAEIKAYQNADGHNRVLWLDANTCSEQDFGADLNRGEALQKFHVRRPDGSTVSGAKAFVEIWEALPRWRWLARIGRVPLVPIVLDIAYALFLKLRPLWRPKLAQPTFVGGFEMPNRLMGLLRTDHAGETGAVMIYRGILSVTRDPQLRIFASEHLDAETRHLSLMNQLVAASERSKLLPLWRLLGWLTGAIPSCFSANAVYATVAAVETFVDQHYFEQIQLIDRYLEMGTIRHSADLNAVRRILVDCRNDELAHRDEALSYRTANITISLLIWTKMVGIGSRLAVRLVRWL